MRPFDPRDVATRHEALCEAELRNVAYETRPWCNGVLGRTEPDVWLNNALGAFRIHGDPPTEHDLAQAAAFFDEKGIEPGIEVSSYANKEIFPLLANAGFQFAGFEAIFALPLHQPLPPPPNTDIDIRRVDPADPDRLREAATIAHTAFSGKPPSEADQRVVEAVMRYDACTTFAARIDGDIAGIGMLQIHDRSACLAFGATHEHSRKRGVQSALMRARLAHAQHIGCDLATVGGRPGAGTERNALRIGFRPAYMRTSFRRKQTKPNRDG